MLICTRDVGTFYFGDFQDSAAFFSMAASCIYWSQSSHSITLIFKSYHKNNLISIFVSRQARSFATAWCSISSVLPFSDSVSHYKYILFDNSLFKTQFIDHYTYELRILIIFKMYYSYGSAITVLVQALYLVQVAVALPGSTLALSLYNDE